MAGPVNWLSQVASVSKFGLLSIPQRGGSVAAAVFGIAGVVAVLVGVLSMGVGFRKTLTASGSPDAAIVLRSGADSEMVSGFLRESTRIIADAPGVARTDDGPLASAELFVIINLPKRSTGTDANVPMRGVERAALKVRDKLKLVEGRMFEWGKNEVIVGVGAASEFAGLELGGKLRVGRREWPIVGIFSAGGGTAESEIWTDASVLQAAYNRGDTFQSVYVKLDLARRIPGVQRRADHRPAPEREGAPPDRVLRRAIHRGDQAHHHARLPDRRPSWPSAPSSARSTPCTAPSRRERAKSPPCAPSASAAARSWSP